VVQTVLDEQRLFRVLLCLLVLGHSVSSGGKTSLLLLLRLRAVLVKQFKKLSRSVAIQSVRELSDSRGDLQTLVEDDFLALEANIFRPFDEASEIALMLDVLADAKVFRLALEERVPCLFGGALLGASGGGGGFLTGSFLGGLVIETNRQYTR